MGGEYFSVWQRNPNIFVAEEAKKQNVPSEFILKG